MTPILAVSADDMAVLVAAAISGFVALVALVVVVLLTRRVHELRDMVRDLRSETVPLVRDARVVVDQAATEMLRVGDVLSSAEAVTGTVDSASRLAYRAFANPVVKVLAFRTGLAGALRRLFTPRTRGRAGRGLRSSSSVSAGVSERSAAPVELARPARLLEQPKKRASASSPIVHRRRRRSRAEA